MPKTYSLNPKVVRKVMDDKLAGKPYDEDQFMFYHLNRNHFNIKQKITSLTKISGKNYRDNHGNTWEEQSTGKNFFHMPLGNWVDSNVGLAKPYSRKFLRDDNASGLLGEFEMIIRHDGKRLDAMTHSKYQETYNFGRTNGDSRPVSLKAHKKWYGRTPGAHEILDVDPHGVNDKYTYKVLIKTKITIDDKIVKPKAHDFETRRKRLHNKWDFGHKL